MTAVVSRFGTSAERAEILNGLLDYREALRAIGLGNGYQWLGGSFVEDVEANRSRPPKDIDLVTISYRPPIDSNAWEQVVHANSGLFNPMVTSQMYKCDAYFVDLNIPPHLIVSDTTYWFGLFSHQRDTSLWKGMLRVPLLSDDDQARQFLVE
jgi:hypothetical protein